MDSRVVIAEQDAALAIDKQPFKLQATKNKTATAGQNTAMLEATIYQEQGSFVAQCSYLFEAVDGNNQALTYVDIAEFKRAVDEYCTEVLATTYYIKSIPRESSLCPKEMQAFNF